MPGPIGFIGLGIMGKPMAQNLVKAGHSLVVHDVRPEPVAELVAAGAESAASPRDVATRCGRIVTMLPNSPEVREVVLGSGGVLEGVQPGAIVIDMSSIAPEASREVGTALGSKKARFLDAPVSGGEPMAVAGTLSIMVGGDEKDFEESKALLLDMGKSAVLVGPVGSGNVAKVANQVIVALNIAAMSEALVLATKAGVEPERVFEAIRGGLAGSNVLEAKALRVMDRNFAPGFRIELHVKDLANALDTGRSSGAPLLLAAQAMEILKQLKACGDGGLDHSGILRFYERLADVEVGRAGA